MAVAVQAQRACGCRAGPASVPFQGMSIEGGRTVRQLRAMADPVRLDLFEALRDEAQPMSTIELERRVPAAKGGIEHHLQRLAEEGWISRVDGAGRSARWAPASAGVTWSDADSTDPDVAAAVDELYWVAQQRRINRLRHFDAERQNGIWPGEWVDAAIGRDYLVHMAPEDLAAFESELVDLVMKYRELSSGKQAGATPGVERVFVTLSAFPLRAHD